MGIDAFLRILSFAAATLNVYIADLYFIIVAAG